MIVNLIVVFITITAGLFFRDKKGTIIKKSLNRRNYIIFVSLILILQSGLRNIGVGADTKAYEEWYISISKLSWSEIYNQVLDYYKFGVDKDPGYLVFQKLVNYIFPNFQIYLIVIATIFFTALGNFIYRNTTRILDIIFAFVLYSALFYSFFSITGIRQTIATAATLWSFELIKKRKLLPFLLFILIASTIHKSVLIFLPFYFIGNLRQTKFIYSLAIIMFPVIMIFKRNFSIYLALIASSDVYMEFAKSTERSGTYTFTILILLISIFGWLFLKRVLKTYPQSYRFYNAVALAVVFTPLTWVDPSLMRVVQYFSIFILIFIPHIINSITSLSSPYRKVFYSVMIATLIFLIVKNGGEYKFFWEYMKLGKNY
jgi:transmembrane protein EpsG